MIKQYNVTVNGTTYEVTVESAAGGRMASAPVSRAAAAPVARAAAPAPAAAPAAAPASAAPKPLGQRAAPSVRAAARTNCRNSPCCLPLFRFRFLFRPARLLMACLPRFITLRLLLGCIVGLPFRFQFTNPLADGGAF